MIEIGERFDLDVVRRFEKAQQDGSGRARVATGAVAANDVDPVVKRDRVEILSPNLWRELLRHSDGTQRATLHPLTRRPLDLGVDESPIERGVVRDEDVALERGNELVAHVTESRRVAHHGRRDVRERRDHRRNRPVGIDERFERRRCNAVLHDDNRDLGDAITGRVSRSRRLDIDDGE